MKLLLSLVFLHFIGDFFLRNKFLDYHKSNIFVLAVHCLCWASIISIGLEYFGQFTLPKFWFLFFGHFIIDWVKGKVDPHPGWSKDEKPDISVYKVIDQSFHLFQILIVWGWDTWTQILISIG